MGVNTKDSSRDQGLAYERRYDIPYDSFYDPSGRTLLAFHGTLNPSAIPSTVVLDKQGRVAASILGEVPSRADPGRPGARRRQGVGLVTPQDLGDWFANTAYDGSLLLAVPVAMVAGLVSFFSPCVVPLLPGYLSYATGLSGADLADARRGRMLAGSLLFVLGFSFVFVSYGALIGAVGEWLFRYERPITIVLGVLTILLGLVFLGVVPWLQRDWRIHQVPAVGLAAAPLLGVLFGLGWAPCIGPTLTAVTALALNEGSAGRGALLSFVYCLGLGLPFIAAALAYRRMLGTVAWVRKHQQWVTAIGGLMLIAVGLLLVTGWWGEMVDWIRTWFFPGFEAGV